MYTPLTAALAETVRPESGTKLTACGTMSLRMILYIHKQFSGQCPTNYLVPQAAKFNPAGCRRTVAAGRGAATACSFPPVVNDAFHNERTQSHTFIQLAHQKQTSVGGDA